MRRIGVLAAAAVLIAGPAFAQASYGQPAPYGQAPAVQPERPAARAPHRAPSAYESQRTRRSTGTPLDVGPHTPQANAAFMGGGAILEGPPGAPAPEPHAITTPPGPDGVVRNYTTIQTN
ncbi:MAG TPA: hypothetical protein VGM87_09825 [Roseomonas sp.]|jgi:hypothetical protein